MHDFLAIFARSLLRNSIQYSIQYIRPRYKRKRELSFGIRVAFCTLSAFNEARGRIILTLKLCSLVRGLIKNERTSVLQR